ncbi:MAG: hypothetical protein CVV24_12430 [Ignavibacteriae bacterium HGW-Ignavibacteriae-3]|nr:MAG: hypothetical protein CVV24_12430 [Ignavibacteriae bacterium HGW-Ignavibacteriae-3]
MGQSYIKPLAVHLLVYVILFLAIGGLFGGICLILYPDGHLLQFPLHSLQNSPFNDFLIPGLILFFLLGIYPLLIFISFFKTASWKFMNIVNIYKDQKSVWSNSLYLGIILVLWIDVEMIYIDYSALQTVYGLVGVAIIILTVHPSVIKYYKA